MTIFVHNISNCIAYLTKEKSSHAISKWQRQIQIKLAPVLQAQKVNVPRIYADMPEGSANIDFKMQTKGPNSFKVHITESTDG